MTASRPDAGRHAAPEAARASDVPSLLCAGLALLLHLACADQYGLFRDELYFVACGKRLAWGYVDQPPLIALIARLSFWLSGEGRSVLLFRLPSALSHAATVVMASRLASRLAGRLGGGSAAVLSGLAVAVAPIHLAQGHLLTMNTFELLLWTAIALAVVDAAGGRPRRWVLAGGLLGLAMLTKYSAGFLAVFLIVGLALTQGRSALRSPWLWAGVAVAAALALPSALWQLRHGLPFLELLRNGQSHKNAPLTVFRLLREALLLQGPVAGLLSLWGLGWLLASRAARPVRFLGVALALLLLTMVLLHAKPYYLAPAVTPLVAAGAAALARAVAALWARAACGALILATSVPAMPLVLPILPLPRMLAWQSALGIKPERLERHEYNDVPQHFADQFGWPERVAAVAGVVHQLSAEDRARAVIFTTNYGRAAALELLARGLELPPVICGHNQYFLWGVPGQPQLVVALGGDPEAYARDFAQVRRVGTTPPVPSGMPYESEIPIFLLQGPRAPLAELFQKARRYE